MVDRRSLILLLHDFGLPVELIDRIMAMVSLYEAHQAAGEPVVAVFTAAMESERAH